MVDLMIWMNLWNWFMDDKNDTLHEFIDIVDVWGDVQPACDDVWCVVMWWGDVVRWCGKRKWCSEVWQKEWKLTRKCHSEYPDKLNQNDWTYKWLSAMTNQIKSDEFIYSWPSSFLFQKQTWWIRWIHIYTAKQNNYKKHMNINNQI